MPVSIILWIEPGKIENPDLDLRYRVPEVIQEHTGGAVRPAGYDYQRGTMLLFLVADSNDAIARVLEVLRSHRILENDLSDTAVALREQAGCRYIYPSRLVGTPCLYQPK